ncbi:S24 family peptidase [Nitrospirillum iridis]|uniref:Phage repressor protein C with HTH and peptisase S24 domain n=1 Tax=Nitrospirillum iridis TaxID=765888 RepID=A0A7X0B1N8_9PROT|nr:S24 family peptidase [Nitrospirillum iridis]MBB6254093.1 phage repressor protein C with HTH and peptisase S24 domain [Nitrospirillum iridis]
MIIPTATASVTPRFMPVEGDSMEPTLRPGDLVAVVPVNSWCGPGLYALEVLPGALELFRCQSDYRGGIVLSRDNPRYSTRTVDQEWFLGALAAKVAGTLNLLDRQLLESRAP